MANDYLIKVQSCIDFIEKNLQQKLRVEDVLEHTYYSYPHFYRLFMDVVGEPMVFYIRKRKLSCAAKELVTTDSSIVEIALRYEFSSQQTFNRSFTNYFGVSPLKYRERGTLCDYYPEYQMKDSFDSPLSIDVTIETLPCMKVASYHLFADKIQLKNYEIEQDKLISRVWSGLIQWQMTYEYQKQFNVAEKYPTKAQLGKFMIQNQLHVPPHTRYFGFINPYTLQESEFGYEAWAMITDDLPAQNTTDIQFKDFSGGLYATATATYGAKSNLDEVWKALHKWMANNKQYEYADHQWLEEHLTKKQVGGFHGFKIYLPIKERTD